MFSGDLGRYDDPVMNDPEPVPEADYVVIESTYATGAMKRLILSRRWGPWSNAPSSAGTVVIPAFAVGRAQSLIYPLWQLKQSGRLRHLPVYLDSPMAGSCCTTT